MTAIARHDQGALAAPLIPIALVLLTGVMTGAQLGKVAPLVPWYQAEIGLSLVAAGWLAALLGIFIALVALPAGWLIERAGLVRALSWGGATLLVGAFALAFVTSPWLIFAARLVEALGYLSLCIVLPAILNAISPLSWKGPVLAIWSGFVPLGFATSDLLAGWMLPIASPAVFLAVMPLLFLVLFLPALFFLRGMADEKGGGAAVPLGTTLSRSVILLTIGFGAFVVLSVAMFTFMPTFVAGAGSHYLVSAGVVALTVPLGNVIASVLIRGRGPRYMMAMAVIGFALSALLALPAFMLSDPVIATLAAIALAMSGALVASAQFAAIPFITPRAGSVPVAIGLVCQAGGIGTVFGPPVAAFVIESFGWPGFGAFLALTALVGLAAMLPLMASAPSQISAAVSPPAP